MGKRDLRRAAVERRPYRRPRRGGGTPTLAPEARAKAMDLWHQAVARVRGRSGQPVLDRHGAG